MNKFRNTKLHRLERKNQREIDRYELMNDPDKIKIRVGFAAYILIVLFGSMLFIMILNSIF